MLEMLLGAIFGIPDREFGVDLDEGMRRRLRFWGGDFRFRVDRAGYVISVLLPPVATSTDTC